MKRQPAVPLWKPQLDEAQRTLLDRLARCRDYWQTRGAYDPEHPLESVESRYAVGESIRGRVPRESHADWRAPANRPDPVEVVVAGNAGRQEDLVPLRMGRMGATPFTFLRGAAAVMAWDLSHTPVTGVQATIDGDAHINNFGLYGTPQRDVIVDLNDFDEALVGPWEWDLKRLVASVNVAGRQNGMNKKERRRAVMGTVKGYRTNMHRLMTMGLLDVWSMHVRAERMPPGLVIPKKARVLVEKAVAKAKRRTNATLLPKVAQKHRDGKWRFVEAPPILTKVTADERAMVDAALADYADTLQPAFRSMLRRYSFASAAHRVVGVGSVGNRAYLALLFGNGDGDPLVLQVKEATFPAHGPYLPPTALKVDHGGARVVLTQRVLQATSDPLLGHTTMDGRPYYVRQMQNRKASIPVEFLIGESFNFWGFLCGSLLSRAHARSGDAAKIAGYCGIDDQLDRALADFAEAYSTQTSNDHKKLAEAIRTGEVAAVQGV
jgi:uncharacterized protein (DUF2252 family)